jgi:hypothetical protein
MEGITTETLTAQTARFNLPRNLFIMSDINNYIAMAVEEDEISTESRQVQSKLNKRFSFLLWPLFIILLLSEAEHYKLNHELGLDEQHLDNIDQLYDQAEQLLTIRFEAGSTLLAPFEDPVLDATIGMMPNGDNKITLFYRADHTQAPGRELVFKNG